MAKDATYGWEDTISTKLEVDTLPTLDYADDYTVKSDMTDGGDVYLTNITSGDQIELLRFGYQSRKNVYDSDIVSKTIDPTMQAPTKRGAYVVVGDSATARIQQPDGNTYDFPIYCNISFGWPISASVTPAMVRQVIDRAYAATYDGEVSNDRLARLMKGSLAPKGVL